MANGFLLLPFLIRSLLPEELGLWYVYVAVAAFVSLFDLGFNSTFSRNIVYVVSGARALLKKGGDSSSVQDGVDWHLLNVVIRSAKLVYAVLAFFTLVFLATFGSVYVLHVAEDMDRWVVFASWALFCAAMTLDLLFLYSLCILRGYGDIAGENQARTFSKLSQFLMSVLLLSLGYGLIGACLGYLVGTLVMRVYALLRIRTHRQIEMGRRSDSVSVAPSDLKGVLATIGGITWRDGLVQLSLYVSTQSMSILCSLYLGLAETGSYSVLLQMASALGSFALVYPRSFLPSFQSGFVAGVAGDQLKIVSRGLVVYWVVFAGGFLCVLLLVLPLLGMLGGSTNLSNGGLFFGLAIYYGLLNQHSLFCNYIISMNEIPYMKGYLVAAGLGILLVYLFTGVLGFGAWGIVVGQGISQIVYNNWRWPRYLCDRIGVSYLKLWHIGLEGWLKRLASDR